MAEERGWNDLGACVGWGVGEVTLMKFQTLVVSAAQAPRVSRMRHMGRAAKKSRGWVGKGEWGRGKGSRRRPDMKELRLGLQT